MRKPSRGIEIFSLSALDILAMSTGAFVVLLTLLMPYYQMTAKAGAEIPEVRLDIAEADVEVEELKALAGTYADAAKRRGSELEELQAELVALEGVMAGITSGAEHRRRTLVRWISRKSPKVGPWKRNSIWCS